MKSLGALLFLAILPLAAWSNGVTVGNGEDGCLFCSYKESPDSGVEDHRMICSDDPLYPRAIESLTGGDHQLDCGSMANQPFLSSYSFCN